MLGWLVVIWVAGWGFYRFCQLLASIDTSSPQQQATPSFQQRQYVHHHTVEQYAGSEPSNKDTGSSLFDEF